MSPGPPWPNGDEAWRSPGQANFAGLTNGWLAGQCSLLTRRADGLRAELAVAMSHLRLKPIPKFGRLVLTAGVVRMFREL
jgi:hypothetical protein